MRIDVDSVKIGDVIIECCAPVTESPLAQSEADQLAGYFKVLSDPARLRLLSLIASKGEACAACDLVDPMGVSQPTVSHHLKVLYEAGLVDREKKGRFVYYRPVPERLDILSRAISAPQS
jgi:ArsR family transcriptional regulator